LKLDRTGRPDRQANAGAMTNSPTTLRRWRRYPVDLPVEVVFHHGTEVVVVPGRGTDISRSGMALYVGLLLKPGDPIEVEFQTPGKIRVASIVRNRAGYCFGLEFVHQLPS
jgi:hypothetical protein